VTGPSSLVEARVARVPVHLVGKIALQAEFGRAAELACTALQAGKRRVVHIVLRAELNPAARTMLVESIEEQVATSYRAVCTALQVGKLYPAAHTALLVVSELRPAAHTALPAVTEPRPAAAVHTVLPVVAPRVVTDSCPAAAAHTALPVVTDLCPAAAAAAAHTAPPVVSEHCPAADTELWVVTESCPAAAAHTAPPVVTEQCPAAAAHTAPRVVTDSCPAAAAHTALLVVTDSCPAAAAAADAHTELLVVTEACPAAAAHTALPAATESCPAAAHTALLAEVDCLIESTAQVGCCRATARVAPQTAADSVARIVQAGRSLAAACTGQPVAPVSAVAL